MSTKNSRFDLTDLAKKIRVHVLHMTHNARTSHVGSCLSVADLLAVLYGGILRVDPVDPGWLDRDRFILSKGHAAAALYATLAERGFFSVEELDSFCRDGSAMVGHVSHTAVPGVEFSTGSLGHGLPVACGMALVGKRERRPYRVVALLSDGECDEGTTWEAALFAAHHELDNLTVIVDYNKIQSFGRVESVLRLEPLALKWKAFGWEAREVDGHAVDSLEECLGSMPFQLGKPSCLVAHTIKGKGVSFMEDDILWHYRSPDAQELKDALAELERLQ